jgi:hypothetical protein
MSPAHPVIVCLSDDFAGALNGYYFPWYALLYVSPWDDRPAWTAHAYQLALSYWSNPTITYAAVRTKATKVPLRRR